jgi:uncharacterized protein with FMN-binding domain
MNQGSNSKKVAAIIGLLVIVAVIAVGALASGGKKNDQAGATTPVTTGAPATSNASTASAYKDGTYSATGSYNSPGGNEDITISLTLKDGVVTTTSAQSGAHEAEGREYQSQFIASYKSQVVGKSLDSLQLSKVSGSSLTSQGFNDAVAQIKAKAKAKA